MSKMKSCLFCSKRIEPSRWRKVNDWKLLRRFFQLLGRHLDQDQDIGEDGDGEARLQQDGDGDMDMNRFENLISAEVLQACEDCSKVVESFCEIYKELKSLELILDWKVWTLQGLMSCSDTDKEKAPEVGVLVVFDEGKGKEELEINKFIVNFKNDLVRKCRRKLQATFPRLQLKKLQSQHQPDMAASTSEPGSDPLAMESSPLEEEESYGSRLRRVHRCPKCKKTFSSPTKLEDHTRRSHEDDEELPIADGADSDSDFIDDAATLDSGTDTELDNLEDADAGTGPSNAAKSGGNGNDADQGCLIVIKTESPEEAAKPEYIFNDETRMYKCGHCPRHFRNLQTWEAHYEKYGKIKYQCVECQISFSLLKYYNKHRRVKHEGVRFQCDRCRKLFTARVSFRKHQQRNTCEESLDLPDPGPDPEDDVNDGTDFFDEEPSSGSGGGGDAKELVGDEGGSLPIMTRDLETGKFNCSTCGKGFNHKSNLKEHLAAVHNQKKPFNCPVCSRRFSTKSYLSRHRKDTQCSTGVPPPTHARRHHWRPCKLCGREFDRNDRLLEHLQKYHSPRTDLNAEEAEDADKVVIDTEDPLENASSFAVVVQAESPEELGKPKYSFNPQTQTYKCGHCSKTYRQLQNWEAHYKKYSKVRYECSICKMSFGRRGDYNKHHRAVHGGQRFGCPRCNKSFTTNFSLTQHHRLTRCGIEGGPSISQDPPQMYPCEVCGKEFNRRNNLQHHIKQVHQKVKSHLCNHCGKGFSHPCQLKVHIERLHSADDPNLREHLCDLCGKGY